MLTVEPNTPLRLVSVATDANGSLFCQASIFDAAGASVGTLSMPHTANGVYAGLYTFVSEGQFTAIYRLYTDAGVTTPAQYDQGMDQISVSTIKSSVARILGLLHENTVVDQQTYTGAGQLLTARIRSYDSKTNANLAGATGLLNTWTITSSYTGANLTNFKIVREP